MHNLRRVLLGAALFFILSAFAVYANGQGEQTNLSGTVSSITPSSSGNTATVVLTTKSGSYTVTVDQSVVKAASLSVGKSISLKGAVHKATDGAKSVDAAEVEVNGKTYQAPTKPATSGKGSAGAGSGSASSSNGTEDMKTVKVEIPEKPKYHHKYESKTDTEKPEAAGADALVKDPPASDANSKDTNSKDTNSKDKNSKDAQGSSSSSDN